VPAHRLQPGFEPAATGLDRGGGVSLHNVPCARCQFVDDPWLDHARSVLTSAGADPNLIPRVKNARGNTVATLREQHVDDLTVLINRPISAALRECRATSMNSGVNICTQR
jgi:hypothetical protein